MQMTPRTGKRRILCLVIDSAGTEKKSYMQNVRESVLMNRSRIVWVFRLFFTIWFLQSAALFSDVSFAATSSNSLILKNDHVLRQLAFDGQVWRTVRFARADGGSELEVDSDEFHILFMDDNVLTIDDYKVVGDPSITIEDGVRKITIDYELLKKRDLHKFAPSEVSVTYLTGDEPYLRKRIVLYMQEGQYIDRLEVERFSTKTATKRGGRGEPVFVGDEWFFGVEYPAFYSRHTDGNTPKAYSGKYDLLGNYSQIFLEGRDEDADMRPGLIRMMHFPGYAKKLGDNRWGIVGKTAVCGVGDVAYRVS